MTTPTFGRAIVFAVIGIVQVSPVSSHETFTSPFPVSPSFVPLYDNQRRSWRGAIWFVPGREAVMSPCWLNAVPGELTGFTVGVPTKRIVTLLHDLISICTARTAVSPCGTSLKFTLLVTSCRPIGAGITWTGLPPGVISAAASVWIRSPVQIVLSSKVSSGKSFFAFVVERSV